MEENTLLVQDQRTLKSYKIPIQNGAVRAMDFRQIKTSADDFGLLSYDPAFTVHQRGVLREPRHLY